MIPSALTYDEQEHIVQTLLEAVHHDHMEGKTDSPVNFRIIIEEAMWPSGVV